VAVALAGEAALVGDGASDGASDETSDDAGEEPVDAALVATGAVARKDGVDGRGGVTSPEGALLAGRPRAWRRSPSPGA
jgi:hypothetical protein